MSWLGSHCGFVRRLSRSLAFWTISGAIAVLVLSLARLPKTVHSRSLGRDHLVSVEELPETSGEMCSFLPAGAGKILPAALQQSRAAAGTAAGSRPPAALEAAVARRPPVRVIRDPGAAFAGVAVDPARNEVALADENEFNLMVYDRRTNTPPAAKMSEPKRIIGGPKSYLEDTCNVYIDPATGDLYGVNNDTMDWLVMFNRSARGNVAPTWKLAVPHTIYGMAVDEQAKEIFLTDQDDHAVVVYKKSAAEQDDALRTLQGAHTQLADPHGIALDPTTGLMYVTNWGSANRRAASAGGPNARSYRGSFTVKGPPKKHWPMNRNYNIPGSGILGPPSITVYRKDAKGDAPPLRVIEGPKTQMNWPTSIAVDPKRKEIFVANDTGNSVTVYRADARGDAAPVRVLKGSRTLIKNPTGVALDLKNRELWVANFGDHAATVFPIDASGNVTPKRVIRSEPLSVPAPMFGNPHTVAYDSKRDQLLVGN